MKTRISAFTLVEITVVLLLSLLLIGIVMLGYRHFEQYRANQKNKSDELSEVLLMHTRLKNCFERAERIKGDIKENELVFIDTSIFVTCKILDSAIIFQQSNVSDTMHIALVNRQINQVENSQLINFLSFEPKNNVAQRRFLYQKQYSSKVLYNAKKFEHEY
ncbi:hypothetical protein [Marinifilum fragile]|uniref:hypothetical protein n=1 Tax=Marinifilum fragile TaxID=570161 RepID=UPI002AAA77B7|nr:hypothetical protein [Marinifilum fragile]